MRILFTICGRAGSKGIKNKNIKNFLGYPLIYYTLSAVQLYCEKHKENNCHIVINTDSLELIHLVREETKVDVHIIQREKDLAQDNTPKVSVIEDCMNRMIEKIGDSYDAIVDLDITSPLRTVENIEDLISKIQKGNCDAVFSITNARRNPYFNMVMKENGNYRQVIKSNFVTRQQTPEVYDMNASLYAYKAEFLSKGLDILEGNCDVIHMYDTAVLDLDYPQDFEIMEVIAKYLFEKQEFKEIYDNIGNVVIIGN